MVLSCCRVRAQVPPGTVLSELSPAGTASLLSVAAWLAAPEGLGPALLVRREVLPGALALLNPAHLRAVVSSLALC